MASIEALRAYMDKLGVLAKPQHSEAVKELAARMVKTTMSTVVFSDWDVQQLNYFFAAYLVEAGMPLYLKVSAYDVVEAHWSHHPKFNNIGQINPECLLLWGGYNDPAQDEHKTYHRMVIDLIDRRFGDGKRTCVALKKGRHPDLEKVLLEYPRSAGEVFDGRTGTVKKEKEKGAKGGRELL